MLLVPFVLLVDLLWLGVIMKNFYAQEIGGILKREGQSLAPRWIPAILVYGLIPAGLVLFVRPQLGVDTTLLQTFVSGALFGLIVYGVYDFTNLAILDAWTLRVTLADIAWGCVLCGTSSMVMRLIEQWLSS